MLLDSPFNLVSLAVFDWNTVDIWHAIDQQQTPPPAQGFDAPVAYVFWRHGQKRNFRSLSPPNIRCWTTCGRVKAFAETWRSVSLAYPEKRTIRPFALPLVAR